MTDARKGSGGIRGESTWRAEGGPHIEVSGPPVAAGPAFARLEQALAEAPVEQLPVLLTALSALVGRLAARMMSVPGRQSERDTIDENLSIEEAARRLGVSTDYLYRHSKGLPFTRRIGRRLLFSARGLERWNRQRA